MEKRIATKSHWCEHLVHEYHQQDSSVLCVILGGQNYSIHKPLCHYSTTLCVQAGYDVLSVQYGFSQNHSLTHFPEDFEILYKEVKEAIDLVKAPRHTEIIWIGKSLGTVLMKRLKRDYSELSQKLILLTPVSPAFDQEDFREKLIIMGTHDEHYDEKLLEKETESMIVEFDGANHALETGSVISDLEIMERVMGAIAGYIQNEE